MDTVKIASKGSRPTHRIVHNKMWDIDEAACGASTHRYKVTTGPREHVTCRSCCLSTR